MKRPATYRFRIVEGPEEEVYDLDVLDPDRSFSDLVLAIRGDQALTQPSFLVDDEAWSQQTMLQKLGRKSCYALDLGHSPRSVRLTEKDELILRRSYPTEGLASRYLVEGGFLSDASCAGLPTDLAIDHLSLEDLVQLGLRELRRCGYLADLAVLALCRFGICEMTRPFFEDVAGDFCDPSLASPGCWSGLVRHHEELRESWRVLRASTSRALIC